MDANAYSPSPPLFRPVKRRMFIRQREDGGSDAVQSSTPSAGDAAEGESQVALPASTPETEELGMSASVPRVKKPFRPRKGGIEFSAASASDAARRSANPEPSSDEVEALRVQAMCDRFTPHTEQKVNVDKHMYGSQLSSFLFFSFFFAALGHSRSILPWRLTR